MSGPGRIIIDVPHAGVWRRFSAARVFATIVVFALFGMLAAVAFYVVPGLKTSRGRFVLLVVWLAAMVGMIAWRVYQHRAIRRRIVARIKANASDPKAALLAVVPLLYKRFVLHGMQEATKQLAAAGHTGLIIRVAPEAELTPIDPLCVEFEPLPLNETEPAFVALRANESMPSSAGPSAAAAGQRARSDASGGEDSPTMRHLRRAARLGGTRLWIIFGLMFVLAAIDAIERRQITTKLIIWSVALGVSLLGPALVAAERGRRFLLLPSSLLRRLSSWRTSAYDLHLFERDKSVLCVYQFRAQSWGLAVADEGKHASAIATRDEIALLLRAWLSPLPPPPITRLSEFAGN